MEGFILAAGLGTRLRPLTDHRPKALVEVGGRTLLELCINRLAAAGVSRCVVNVHHFGDMMIDYIASHQWPCEVAVSDERALLLDTGGALRHAAPLFSGTENILVHNVDILSKVDLTPDDLEEMLTDSGITMVDLLQAYLYLKSSDAPENTDVLDMEESLEAPLYLMRYYERELSNWFLLGGFDVMYDNWGL